MSFREKKKIIKNVKKPLKEEVSSFKILYKKLKWDDFSQCYARLKLQIETQNFDIKDLAPSLWENVFLLIRLIFEYVLVLIISKQMSQSAQLNSSNISAQQGKVQFQYVKV